jgi:hypothetical protein
VIGLGQSETADQLATRQCRDPLLLLFLRACNKTRDVRARRGTTVVVDWADYEARLHAHCGAVAAVHALHFTGQQAVAHEIRPRAAVALNVNAGIIKEKSIVFYKSIDILEK